MLEVNYLLLPRTTQLPSLLSAKSSGAAGPAWCRQPWEGRPGQARPALQVQTNHLGQACAGRPRAWHGGGYAIYAEGSHHTYSYTGRALGKQPQEGQKVPAFTPGRRQLRTRWWEGQAYPCHGAAHHYRGSHFVNAVAILSSHTPRMELAPHNWGQCHRLFSLQRLKAGGDRLRSFILLRQATKGTFRCANTPPRITKGKTNTVLFRSKRSSLQVLANNTSTRDFQIHRTSSQFSWAYEGMCMQEPTSIGQ